MSKARSTAVQSDFIAPVAPPALAKASSKRSIGEASRCMDASSKRIRDLEWQQYIRSRRQHANQQMGEHDVRLSDPGDQAPADLTAIALSGGGIRSATFGLGVLQALAGHDLLRRFDYLSTVSGGGYIGSSLTWLTSTPATAEARAVQRAADEQAKASAEAATAVQGDADPPRFPEHGFGPGPSREPIAEVAPPFPYGSDDPRDAREPDGSQAEGAMLRYLRQHGNYLTPGNGITLTSVIVVLLRGIILNLLVWIPIVAAVMWCLISLSVPRVPDLVMQWLSGPVTEFARSLYQFHWMPAGLVDFLADISPPLERGTPGTPDLFSFGVILAAAIALFAGCVLAFAIYSLATWWWHKSRLWLGGTKYGWRRGFENWIRLPFWIIGGLLLLGSVPFAAGSLHGWLLGSSFSAIGLASGLIAFVRTMQQPKSQAERQASWAIPSSWIASFGAAFLLYGVLLVSYGFGWWAARGSAGAGVSFWVLCGALLAALVTGYAVDLNLITVHRFYRDRLMEAFLPDIHQALRNQTAAAKQADSAVLSKMCDPARPVGPYHLINTNLVLIKSNQRTYRLRGGDSFILSPLYCGSNATGWQPTDAFMGDELTLPTAMAISGAAANPWAGSAGVGVTRNPLVSMLMALMNLRLGFWLPNPNPKTRERWWRRSCAKSFRANHFEPGLKEVIGASLREDSPVCLLSDGGHFENLGLYELIRRRPRLIVVCDGTADPDYAFSDLLNALARVGTDFGARIEFDRQTTLQCFMPSIEAVYPREVRLSKSAYAVADITYADDSPAKLIYLTTALCQGLRLRLLGYKGANPDFPDQPTADQFFDEEQFEAYRELGYFIASAAAREIAAQLGLPPLQEPDLPPAPGEQLPYPEAAD